MLIAAAILALTYIGVIFTRLPHINIDRPAAALTGSLLMVLLGKLSFQGAVAAVDFNTLALLLGMMLLIQGGTGGNRLDHCYISHNPDDGVQERVLEIGLLLIYTDK